MRIIIVRFSEIRRLGNSKTSSKGFTYYWSNMINGHHFKGLDIGISSTVQPSIVEVTADDKRVFCDSG